MEFLLYADNFNTQHGPLEGFIHASKYFFPDVSVSKNVF